MKTNLVILLTLCVLALPQSLFGQIDFVDGQFTLEGFSGCDAFLQDPTCVPTGYFETTPLVFGISQYSESVSLPTSSTEVNLSQTQQLFEVEGLASAGSFFLLDGYTGFGSAQVSGFFTFDVNQPSPLNIEFEGASNQNSSFSISSADGSFDLSANVNDIGNVFITSGGNDVFSFPDEIDPGRYTLNFNASPETAAGTRPPGILNLRVSAVPEPSSLLLASLCMAGLTVRRTRYRS